MLTNKVDSAELAKGLEAKLDLSTFKRELGRVEQTLEEEARDLNKKFSATALQRDLDSLYAIVELKSGEIGERGVQAHHLDIIRLSVKRCVPDA